jgi:hypothetical protein
MRYWFDTEFIEDGKTINLISIGFVSEDDRTYYAENKECNLSLASNWVKENVLCHLSGPTKSRKQIAQEIQEFVGESPEIWAYYADYDWVVLCQLYGTMMQLPKTWPMYALDIKQYAYMLGNPKLPEQTLEHNALADAKWNKVAWEFLTKQYKIE